MRGVIFKCFPKTAFNEEQCRFTTKSKSIKKTLPIVASHQQTPGNILSYSLQRALCVYNLMLQTNLLFFFFFTQAFPLFLFFYDHSLAPLPLKNVFSSLQITSWRSRLMGVLVKPSQEVVWAVPPWVLWSP